MIKVICDQGYPVETRTCRCRETHYREVPCFEDHNHVGWPMDMEGNPLPGGETRRVCPRCEELAPAKSFRGSVCGFCADVLEKIDAVEPARFEP